MRINEKNMNSEKYWQPNLLRWLCCLALAMLLAYGLSPLSSVFSQVENAEDAVKVSTTWSVDSAQQNEQVVLAVVLNIAEGYHVGNAKHLIRDADKELVMPTTIRLSVVESASNLATNVRSGLSPSRSHRTRVYPRRYPPSAPRRRATPG